MNDAEAKKQKPRFIGMIAAAARLLPLIGFATSTIEVWSFGIANALLLLGVTVFAAAGPNPLAAAFAVVAAYVGAAWVCDAYGRTLYARGVREGFLSTIRGAAAEAAALNTEEAERHEAGCPECALDAKLNRH